MILVAYDKNDNPILSAEGTGSVDYQRNILRLNRIRIELGRTTFIGKVRLFDDRKCIMVWVCNIVHDGWFGVGPYTGKFYVDEGSIFPTKFLNN